MSETAIEVRPLRFAVDASVPRYWHGGRKAVTTFFDTLSIFFPEGERFFIHSVRALEHRVTDERVRADVRAFCGQEGAHSREHARYNDWLRSQGYPIDALERREREELHYARTHTPPHIQLAVTCALEHFTALLGQALLEDPRILEGAHPEMAALWRWHAAEENEHKAVAYDVYLAAGGGYFTRVLVMVEVTLMFWARVLENQIRMMKANGTLWEPREWLSLAHFLWVRPGGMRRVVGRYLHYFRPSFHPSDIDSSDVVTQWRRQYEASPSPPAA